MSPWSALCAAILAVSGTPLSALDAPLDEITSAKRLIAIGDYDAAEQALKTPPPLPGQQVELDFLLGIIAIAKNNPRGAIASFRRALVHEPSSIRLRLELARAFYLAKDYENAFRQFQRARAGNPPPQVVASIEQYLLAIRLEKNWSYNLRFSFAPDSNLNSATSATSTEILGLPFELDDSARRKTGVGMAAEAGGEYAPKIGNRARLRFGAQILRRDYRGNDFDDMSLIVHAGPRLIRTKWDLSLLGTAYRRWYGGERFADGRGARFEIVHYPNSRMQISSGLFGQQVRHQGTREEDGLLFGANLAAVRSLSPSSAAVGKLGVARQTARLNQYANWSATAGVGYLRDVKGGFSIYVEPNVTGVRHDGEELLFGKQRTDYIGQVTVAILNRRIVASRFTPRVGFTHTRRFSNIDLYDFKKSRIEIGLTSEF